MRARVLGPCIAASLLLTTAGLAGCVTDEIVVATLEAGPPDHPPGGQLCDKSSDCLHSNERCEKPHCEGDAHGHCELWPPICGTERAPTCGCDGISYWNDCVRKQSGVASSTPHECEIDAATCSTAADCPIAGASCAHLLPPGAMCSGQALGVCWMLPLDCPDVPSPEAWTSCADPKVCVDTCAAIRSGAVYQRNPMHPCP